VGGESVNCTFQTDHQLHCNGYEKKELTLVGITRRTFVCLRSIISLVDTLITPSLSNTIIIGKVPSLLRRSRV
jgi:hypothetical protein